MEKDKNLAIKQLITVIAIKKQKFEQNWKMKRIITLSVYNN